MLLMEGFVKQAGFDEGMKERRRSHMGHESDGYVWVRDRVRAT